jgi:hypothetical protein
VAQIWLFGSTAGYLAYRAVRFLADRGPGVQLSIPSRRRLLNATGGALLAAPFALVGYGALVERLDFHVREVEIPVPNLPDGLDGLRLLHLSDIHLSAFLSEKDLARVIDSANELRPHLALVTGDLITPPAIRWMLACGRSPACARTPAFWVAWGITKTTPWESYTEREGARLGIPFLRGRAQPCALAMRGAERGGRGLPAVRPRLSAGAERLVLPGAYNVLLSHNPDVFPVAVREGIRSDAGRPHARRPGDVEILHQPINAARFFTPFVYGLYRRGAAAEYVTRGIGTIGIPCASARLPR